MYTLQHVYYFANALFTFLHNNNDKIKIAKTIIMLTTKQALVQS